MLFQKAEVIYVTVKLRAGRHRAIRPDVALIVYRPAFSCSLPKEVVLRKVRPSCPVFLTDFHPFQGQLS